MRYVVVIELAAKRLASPVKSVFIPNKKKGLAVLGRRINDQRERLRYIALSFCVWFSAFSRSVATTVRNLLNVILSVEYVS